MKFNIDLSNKKTITGIIMLICIIGIIFYLPHILTQTNPDTCMINDVCQHEERVNLLISLVPIFILIGIIFGAIIFLFITNKLEEKDKDIEKITSTLVKFLSKDEKLVIEKILQEDGKILQAQISRIEGLGKLKSHRTIQKLIDKCVIEKEQHGKTNIIKLKKEIRDTLIKK